MVASHCVCCSGDGGDEGDDRDRHDDNSVLWPKCFQSSAAPFLLRLPDLLWEAHQRKRLLFLDYTLAPGVGLTEFLEPPVGGIDWRVPRWLSKEEMTTTSKTTTKADLAHLLTDDHPNFLEHEREREASSFLLHVIANTYSRLNRKRFSNAAKSRACAASPTWMTRNNTTHAAVQNPLAEIFHDVWRVFFTPSDVLGKRVINVLRTHKGMDPAEYVAVDLRGTELPTINDSERDVKEAMNCALTLYPTGGRFFVTSNTPDATDRALQCGNVVPNVVVQARSYEQRRQQQSASRGPPTADDFYESFIDLYVMGAISRCVVYKRQRSIGHLASLMSYDATCGVNLDVNPSCNETTVKSQETLRGIKKYRGKQKIDTSRSKQKHWFERGMPEDGVDFSRPRRDNSSIPEKSLPTWVTDYFVWHNATKAKLNENNWKSTKYLVLVCFADQTCGGLSDRIKPLPAIILAAKRSQRLLLIYWERPGPLENWLVPPKSGVDWRIPTWMSSLLMAEIRPKRSQILATSLEKGETLLKGGQHHLVILMKIQSPEGGELYYKDQADSQSTYQDVFHEIFRRFFTPVPRMARVIESEMADHNLVPGQYAAVHLRAMYGNRKHRDAQEMAELAALGINCASNLLPGKPIYFASDTGAAVNAARNYSLAHSLPIASLEFDYNPLHLDKDTDWENRTASQFDATFVDLFMLAQSRCVAYSNGGYGTFGSLLSFESDCSLRFFAGKRKAKRCRWMPTMPTDRAAPGNQLL